MSNLALNKYAFASSYVAPFTATKAVDGTITPLKRWLCEAMPCWMAVDLGETFLIDRWVVKHMGASGWLAPQYNMKDFRLQGSLNNSTWFDIDVVASNTAYITDRPIQPTQVRYVRVFVNAGLNINQGVASIVEFEVYESAYDPYLSGLSISSGTLNPAFGRKTFAYTDQVGSDVPSVTVTPTAEAPNSVIKVNGLTVISGQPSQDIVLVQGDNNITVAVTNGPITQSYTISVNKPGAAEAVFLSSLILKGPVPIPLVPTFTKLNLNYTANATGKSSVTVTPTQETTGSIIMVNNLPVTSGQPSQSISLSPGSNTITIQVSPAGGGNPTTYTIIATR